MTDVGTKGILEKCVTIKFGHATSMEIKFYVDVNLKLYQYISSRFLIEASGKHALFRVLRSGVSRENSRANSKL